MSPVTLNAWPNVVITGAVLGPTLLLAWQPGFSPSEPFLSKLIRLLSSAGPRDFKLGFEQIDYDDDENEVGWLKAGHFRSFPLPTWPVLYNAVLDTGHAEHITD